MKLIDFLNDYRIQGRLEKYWKMEFYFTDVLNEETKATDSVKIGKLFDEWYVEGFLYSSYYKRFGNLVRRIPDKEREVKCVTVGCSGVKFCCTLNLEELGTKDKFFEIF